MILVTDIGNTTIALTALSSDFSFLFEEKVPTDTGRDEALFMEAALECLKKHGIPADGAIGPAAFEAAAVSSVVPACTGAAVLLSEKLCGVPPVLISCECDTGLFFTAIPAPQKVGADRIADAAWAAAAYPLPAMTVDMGTATTINVISKKKEFLGGMIGAGVWTSLRALGAGAAQLPDLTPGSVPRGDLIGRDTAGCMLSASVVGTAAMIDGLAALVEEGLGLEGGQLTLILTGGNSGIVSEWIRHSFVREPHLAAKGCALIAMRHLKKSREIAQICNNQ